jgi:sec-independent protein translocase protein TatA
MFTLPPILAFLDVGGPEILIVMLVTLLLFGSKRMPDLARSLGKSLRELKKAASGLEEELKRAIEATPPPPPKPQPRAEMDAPPKAAPASSAQPPQPPEGFHYP